MPKCATEAKLDKALVINCIKFSVLHIFASTTATKEWMGTGTSHTNPRGTMGVIKTTVHERARSRIVYGYRPFRGRIKTNYACPLISPHRFLQMRHVSVAVTETIYVYISRDVYSCGSWGVVSTKQNTGLAFTRSKTIPVMLAWKTCTQILVSLFRWSNVLGTRSVLRRAFLNIHDHRFITHWGPSTRESSQGRHSENTRPFKEILQKQVQRINNRTTKMINEI